MGAIPSERARSTLRTAVVAERPTVEHPKPLEKHGRFQQLLKRIREKEHGAEDALPVGARCE